MEAWFFAAQTADLEALTRLYSTCSRMYNDNGETALMLAAKRDIVPVVKLLAARELRMTDYNGRSALFFAKSKQVAMILAGEVDISDAAGDFALHHFAFGNKIELVELFADHCKQQNASGRTPLHVAAQAGHYECCVLLSNAIGIRDYQGKYALLGAICSGNAEIVYLLRGEVDAEALRFACMTGEDVLKVLADEAKYRNLHCSFDEFTRKQVYDVLHDDTWKHTSADVDDDVEFEYIKQQLKEAAQRIAQAELPEEANSKDPE